MSSAAEIFNACMRHVDGFNKITTPFFVNWEKVDFVTAPANRIYSLKAVQLPFMINGTRYSVARKGCRPQTTLRAEFSFPGQTKYLIKFSDGEVRLCGALHSVDTPIQSRSGDVIAAAELDVGYLYLLLQGAGGGGAGSSAGTSGAGAGRGALLIACIDLDSPWQIDCGAAGQGGGHSSNGGNGGNTTASRDGMLIIAGGGEGGQFDQRGGNGGVVNAPDNGSCHLILSVNGAAGSDVNGKGNGFSAVTSENYADNGENYVISFPEVERAWDAIGFHGGSGASSAFGEGGKGEGLAFDGGDAQGYGAGGGGAGSTPARNGGKGGDGCIKFYY